MNFQIISLFPQFFHAYLSEGVIHQAHKKGLFQWSLINPRDFTEDQHRSVDDRPFGGGDGMVMLPEIMEKALAVRKSHSGPVIYLSPQGEVLNEFKVQQLSKVSDLTLICGRYGGIDQRFLNQYVDEEISIGDYVLSGGELAALVLIDAVVRKQPGSLGNDRSAESDSFAQGQLLEHPLFTRPPIWNSMAVPEILRSGHHEKIKQWQQYMAKLITWKKRPDLLKLSDQEKLDLSKFYQQLSDKEKQACGVENLQGL